MLTVSDAFKSAMVAPVRRFRAKVDIKDNSTNTTHNYTEQDRVKTVEIQRVGDNSKFYGYGICQRINIKLVDLEDSLKYLNTSCCVDVDMGIVLPDGTTEYVDYPTFYITETNRSEEDGEVSITGYDMLDKATLHTVSELDIDAPYTIEMFIVACGDLLGVGVTFDNFPQDDYALTLSYPTGGNFAGTESIREALNAAAEATQSIYYIDNNNNLHFRRFDKDGAAVATITENDYYTLNHSSNRRLAEVMHCTELGDNVSAKLTITGTTQYIRNNPFWEMRTDDIGTVVDNALAVVGGLTINQFDCNWRGNLPLEIGDKIDLKQVCLDGCVEAAYVLDDVVTYDGGYQHTTQWNYSNTDAETESTPSSVGEALKDTFAKVDKINNEITLVASKSDDNSHQISSIKLDTESIVQSVEDLKKNVEDTTGTFNDELVEIKKSVDLAVTSEDLQIKINEAVSNGVDKVETATGYKFDADGLTISKTDSEISTQITENGMVISKNDDAVLTVNNQGVNAANLHATTYLIIGTYSRFEDYEKDSNPRTGCFWIGG